MRRAGHAVTRRAALGAWLAVAWVIAHAAPADVGTPPGTARVLVRLEDDAPLAELLARAADADAVLDEIVTRAPLRAIVRVRSGRARDAARLAAEWSTAARIRYAVAERFWPMELRRRHEPDDPLFPLQWPLDNTGQGGDHRADREGGDVNAPEAWAYTLGSPDVVIAVLDDGVQLDHPDLVANIASAGRDFTVSPPVDGAQPRAPDDRHGTAVAGVAAARGDNALGVTGICPRCRILPVRVHGSSNLGTAAAFRYAVEQGAQIVTNSWGYTRAAARSIGGAADAAVRDAIDSAARDGRGGRGTLVVFGVTNESVDNCTPPHADISSLESVVAVGVSNHDDVLGGSGFGQCLDLVAPSRPMDRSTIGVPTTDRTGIDGHTADDYFTDFGGTSAAAPLVAGIAGLLLSLNPALTRADLVAILELTADKIDPAAAHYDATGFSPLAGYGRVNAARALVPTARIRVEPERVAVGEPFTVIVTASAPFGVSSASWAGWHTGVAALDAPHVRALRGDTVASATWSALTVDQPGTYVLEADAASLPRADEPAGYPRRASETGARSGVPLIVVERADAASR